MPLFKSKTTVPTLEDRVAASTQALNDKTITASKALTDLSIATDLHYGIGDEINDHIETTKRAAEARVASLTELQQNAYAHADATAVDYLT